MILFCGLGSHKISIPQLLGWVMNSFLAMYLWNCHFWFFSKSIGKKPYVSM